MYERMEDERWKVGASVVLKVAAAAAAALRLSEARVPRIDYHLSREDTLSVSACIGTRDEHAKSA